MIPGSELYTQSQIRAVLTCLRYHHYTYRLGYRPVSTALALRFGSLIHRGTEAWWRAYGQPATDRLAAALKAMRAYRDALAERSDEPLDEHTLAMAEALMIGYHARWQDEPVEPLITEGQFRFDVYHHVDGSHLGTIGGQVDNLVRDTRTGEIYLIERKTSSDDITPGSDYWRALAIDHQVSTYYAAAAALGYDVVGCIYDVIAKPRLRPQLATPPEKRRYTKDGRLYAGQRETDETPDEYRDRILEAIERDPNAYFQRGIVARDGREMVRYRQDLQDAITLIKSGMTTRNPTACRRYGRLCEFFDVCSGAADLSDETRFRKVETIHEELEERQ